MNITDYIGDKIERLPKGYVFTYIDFFTEVNNKEAVIKELNREAVKLSPSAQGIGFAINL